MLTDDLVDVFVVDGTTMDEVEKQLRKFKESVKIVNTFHPPSKIKRTHILFMYTNVYNSSHSDMQTQSISFTNYNNGGPGSNGNLANGNTHHPAMSNETVELTPVINIQQPAPPAISVVTFRWDTSTAQKDNCRGAPDR